MNVLLISNALETPTTRRIRLDLDGLRFAYQAGQAASLAVDVYGPTPYSIASAPSDTRRDGALEFLVKVDGATRFGSCVATLAPGAAVHLDGPAGAFTLRAVPADAPLLFVAGGTGIAPLRSMIREALHDGRAGSIGLVYSARIPSEFAYMDEWRELADAGRITLTLTLTGGSTDWLHARGRTGIDHLRELVTPDTRAFLCGPTSMLTDVKQALGTLGLPGSAVSTEDW